MFQSEKQASAEVVTTIETEDPIAGMVIGRCPALLNIMLTAHQVATYPLARVLLQGESGTGKDVIARVIHELSHRSSTPGLFVPINCAAIPEDLLETELFGVEAGAYTDAKFSRDGLLARAHRGTLFLDEIGAMPLVLQAKLLRFLETCSFRRVGGTKEFHVQLRVISATNTDLQAAVARKMFRDDLFYRLNVVTLFMPPLRERQEDLPLLIEHFLRRESARRGIALSISDEAMSLLLHYTWPGNIRELQHAIEQGCILCDDNVIRPQNLLNVVSTASASDSYQLSDLLQNLHLPAEGINLSALLAGIEYSFIQDALKRCGGNQVRAAALLGISRDKLRYRLASRSSYASEEAYP
ncbi:sigma-54 interaction domain-containing protein [Dictyobacter arantiisoli]|uniref:Sigma-54 factor interaction domain-containing protein n=1 Tax=Dictyobacter arantiisoli TaxID=2014874 RepID=A0A5A5T8W2_9CHLR|nr:sigma-54 dependent transcriptional regulator [Dictyobacter arantiisoli]GCF07921.1 hypothetical protein KDI_14850 [Dictyobacter arantiisoli]